MLGRWKKEFEQPEAASPISGKMTVMRAELKRLQKEKKQLKLEREILKRRQPFSPRNRDKVSVY
jgi:transposase